MNDYSVERDGLTLQKKGGRRFTEKERRGKKEGRVGGAAWPMPLDGMDRIEAVLQCVTRYRPHSNNFIAQTERAVFMLHARHALPSFSHQTNCFGSIRQAIFA